MPATPAPLVRLELEDGTIVPGVGFGHPSPAWGEVVFSTGMVGYEQSLTDPSFRGQILVLTYPLIGNYGVPAREVAARFESGRIQAAGLVVAQAMHEESRPDAARTLAQWLAQEGIPGLCGVDTRALTLRLRERGTLLGRLVPDGTPAGEIPPFADPNSTDLVAQVSVREPVLHTPHAALAGRTRRVILVDCGVKRSILASLLARGVEVLQVPHDFDYTGERFDGVLLSNGPGDPARCTATIEVLRRALALNRPVFGICLGSQLMALAAGARTYKLRYGHRGQNQPCREVGTPRCRLTSQNHGFAVDAASLPDDWEVWMSNANDGSVEGIRSRRRPFRAVQFHPEASPGPLDSRDLFDEFAGQL
jgi:carbamoyl-phosphate synthase small subunit